MASSVQLEYEILGYISEFIQILDRSNNLFLLSRFSKNPKRRRYYQQLYEEILPKSDLILKEFWNVKFFKTFKKLVGK